jgi:protein-disulfide isomerase
MKKKSIVKTITTTLLAGAVLTSCQNKVSNEALTTALEKNPDIILNSIKKNPIKYLEALQEASKIAQGQLAKKREESELSSIKKQLKNPLRPTLLPEDIYRGRANAPITIVEYTDFQCSFCKKANTTVKTLLEKYPNQVKVIYKNLPLDFHPQAMLTARYFEAIGRQDRTKALQFHDEVFKNQRQLGNGEIFLKKLASKFKVNLKQLNIDLADPKLEQKITAHMEEAASFNITGTPGFIVGGVAVKGAYPVSHFDMIIKLLKEEKKLVLNE